MGGRAACPGFSVKVLLSSSWLPEDKISSCLARVALVSVSRVRLKEQVSWRVLVVSPRTHFLVHMQSASVKGFAFPTPLCR